MKDFNKTARGWFEKQLCDHLAAFSGLKAVAEPILIAGETMAAAIGAGRKILVCGNGGSAADAQHFAAELVGRFELERRALPAIALTTDTSILTAVSNDHAFEFIFSRQVEALGRRNDILVCISTSGNSLNVLRAAEIARSNNLKTIGLLGKDGGFLGKAVDLAVLVDAPGTARIQEVHSFILHFWCSVIERRSARVDPASG